MKGDCNAVGRLDSRATKEDFFKGCLSAGSLPSTGERDPVDVRVSLHWKTD